MVETMVLISCKNPIEKVKEFIPEDTITSMVAFNISFLRSDSGQVVVELRAPLMNQLNDKNQTLEFPNGFEADFLNSRHQVVSSITADYGISYENSKSVEARGNVVVLNNDTRETMYTDNLVWNQKEKMIHAHSPVKIVAPDKVVFGDSLKAREDFSQHTIYNIHNSTIEVEE